MAPEQCQSSRDVDIRADIYSLGCTLYCLLCGRPPFGDQEHGSVATKLTAHIAETPKPVSTMSPQAIPAELERIVSRMMAKDPKQRFQTPGEVAAALAPFVAKANLLRLTAGITTASNMTDQLTRDLEIAKEEAAKQNRANEETANEETEKTIQLKTTARIGGNAAGNEKRSLPSLSCTVTIALGLMMAVMIPYAWNKIAISVTDTINSVTGMGGEDAIYHADDPAERSNEPDADLDSEGASESKVKKDLKPDEQGNKVSGDMDEKIEEIDEIESDASFGASLSKTAPVTTSLSAEYLERLKKDKDINFEGQELRNAGKVGKQVFATSFGECVRIKAEFDRPMHCYLIALNPTEDREWKVQLCYPADATDVPKQVEALSFPESETTYFALSDGVGQVAWILVQSQEARPPFEEWRKSILDNDFPWKKHKQGGVWIWDGEKLLARHQSVTRGKSVDITPVVLKKVINDLLTKKVDFRALAFPIGGTEGKASEGMPPANDEQSGSAKLGSADKQMLSELVLPGQNAPAIKKLSTEERKKLGSIFNELSVGVTLRGGFVELVKGAFTGGQLQPKKWAQLGGLAQEIGIQAADAEDFVNRLNREVADGEHLPLTNFH
jgi:hypothetical protein